MEIKDTVIHETKVHGTLSFPFIVYCGKIPEFLHSYPMHWHDEMELIYITKGTGVITVQSKSYTMHAGDIIILPPQTLHAIEQLGKEEMHYFNILFQFSLLNDTLSGNCYAKYFLPFYEHTKTFPTYIACREPLNQNLTPYITDLIEHRKQSNIDYELMVKSNLLAIIHFLHQYSNPAKEEERSRQNTYDKLKKLFRYVQIHYDENLTIEQAAGICGFSKSHFMKLFKELTGKSFSQYLKDYRLEIAASLLIETNQKVIEIAENTGFHNHSYFTRSFLNKYGKSPSQYRKENMKTGDYSL